MTANERRRIAQRTKHARSHSITAACLTRRLRAAWRKAPLICAQKLLRSAAGMGDKDSSGSGFGSGCGCRWWSASALTRRNCLTGPGLSAARLANRPPKPQPLDQTRLSSRPAQVDTTTCGSDAVTSHLWIRCSDQSVAPIPPTTRGQPNTDSQIRCIDAHHACPSAPDRARKPR